MQHVDRLDARLRALELQNAANQVLLQQLQRVERDVDELRKTVTRWGGALAVIVPLFSILAPLLWKAVFGSGVKAMLFSNVVTFLIKVGGLLQS
jgi:hypothetical protein